MDNVLDYRKKPKSLTIHYIIAYVLGVSLIAICYFPLAMAIIYTNAESRDPSRFIMYVLAFPFLYLPKSWIDWLDAFAGDAGPEWLLACNGIFWGIVIISIGAVIFWWFDPGEKVEKDLP